MSTWARLFMMVPVALRAAANAAAEGLDFDTGQDTFEVPLGPAGAEVPTHYGASTLVRPHTALTINEELLPSFPGASVYAESEGWNWRTARTDAGLVVLTGEA